MKKILAYILTVCALFAVPINKPANAQTDSLEKIIEDTAKYVYGSTKNPQVGTIGGEWAVFGLSRSGCDIPEEHYGKYFENAKRYIKDCGGVLSDKKYTEYSRLVTALTAIGKNPSDIEGYDLTAPLGNYEKTTAQGLNGAVWALIALDCGDYETAEDVRSKYVDYILSRQLPDGGWEMSGNASVSDPDMTGMALSALSNYSDRAQVKAAEDKAVTMLSQRQNDSGGYSSWGNENLESTVWVMIAANELGISIDDSRFIKNGHTILDGVLSFYNGKGGFKHSLRDSEINQIATEQALYGLCSLKRALNGENNLFDLSDHITLPEITEGEAFGLRAKINDITRVNIQYPAKTFTDVWTHKNQAAIEALAIRGIINGKTDEEFEPDGEMTRAEFAAVVVRTTGLPFKEENPFKDVSQGDWFFDYINTAYFYGIVSGVSDDEFDPYGTITREAAAVMVSRAAALCGLDTQTETAAVQDTLAGFVDYKAVSDWARESLAFCYMSGILDDDDIEIKPQTAVLRAEIAQMLFNMMGRAELL